VIVRKIDVERVPVFEPKDNPPVRADRGGPVSAEVAFQRVQAKSREVHRFDFVRAVEREQDQPDFFNVFRGKPAPVVALEQPTQRLVLDFVEQFS
jgi:hypothetical protein